MKGSVSDLVSRIEGYNDSRFEVIAVNKEEETNIWLVEVKELPDEEDK